MPLVGDSGFIFFMVISQQTADNILAQIESMYFSVVKIPIEHVLSRGGMLGKRRAEKACTEHTAGELFSSCWANYMRCGEVLTLGPL